ncbi:MULTISPECIES: PAS domain S-box protein [Salinibaculum]|uniref:PAS domain S-box protein n=1 Tax=Salinibaculum TaxID=2732368 RepID=UPI0030D01382
MTTQDECAPGVDSGRPERPYPGLLEAVPDAVLVTDAATGDIVDTNEAGAALLGRPREDVVGMAHAELYPAAEWDRLREHFEPERRSDGQTHELPTGYGPVSVRTAEDGRVPVEVTATKGGDDGSLVHVHLRDLRERLDRQRAFRAFIGMIPDRAAVYDADGEAQEILARRGSEPAGVAPDDAVDDRHAPPADEPERIRERIRRTLERGEREQFEFRATPEDGAEPRWFEARTAPIPRPGSDAERVACLARDVTERKRREQTLRSFREAVEQAGHVIMITDADGTIEYVNPAFEEVTGYDAAEALGEQPSLLKSGAHDDATYDDMWETILAGDVWEGELENERKNGEQYYIEQTIAPIPDGEGSVDRFVAINTDVTERKQFERQLQRERDRLETFARTISHDLRNPLTVAHNYVELALEEDDAERPLDRALDALERMDRLIDDVLTLSKQGRTVDDPEPVDVAAVVEDAWEHTPTADATLAIDDDIRDVTVAGDRSRLCEVFENLFQNAVEHGGPGVTVSVKSHPAATGIVVEDDGPGIPPGHRERIFDNGRTTVDSGSGFGLAIVDQIIQAHGWDVRVGDSLQGGARFEIVTSGTPSEHSADK